MQGDGKQPVAYGVFDPGPFAAFKMTAAKLRLAMASMGQPETKVGDLCKELGVTRQTLYRHVSPKGELRPDGAKLLGGG